MVSLDAIRCGDCAAVFYPAADFCPRCGGSEVAVTALATQGVVVSATAVGDDVIAEVLLDDGMPLLAHVIATPPLAVGSRVRHVTAEEMRFELDG